MSDDEKERVIRFPEGILQEKPIRPDFKKYFKDRRKWLFDNTGWVEIEDQSSIWNKFNKLYDFTPSIFEKDWPGIEEPVPSATFKIDHYFPEYESKEHYDSEMDKGNWPSEAFIELGNFYKQSFQKIMNKGDKVVALDWQHTCYRFDPWSEFDHWEILPIPNGDYYIFLTPDLRCGFFGHPWERTVCVMGESFVKQLPDAPAKFTKFPIRVNGR